jgi:hypothetical protein
VQGKAERVKPAETLALLERFYRDKLALRQRHVAAARHVSQYDYNNAYQYVIARDDAHLGWLRSAIEPDGGAAADVAEPEIRGGGDEALARILAEDRDLADAFVARWRNPVEALTHARHQSMLRVILGETLEHKRFFEQALAGRTDLLGRHPEGTRTGGRVLSTRWVE